MQDVCRYYEGSQLQKTGARAVTQVKQDPLPVENFICLINYTQKHNGLGFYL